MACDLVHFNLAIGKAPLDHPTMSGFVDRLEAVNRLAESSPGFIWTPSGDEAGRAAEVFGNPLVLANMSTWQSLEHLFRFVYQGAHGHALSRRRDWFETTGGPAYVLWWAPAGHRPNWLEAKEKLQYLAEEGPTPQAFTFTDAFSEIGTSVFVAC